MDVSNYVKQELARLRDENEALRDEVQRLRHAVDWFQTMMDAVDAFPPGADLLPLLDCILSNAEAAVGAEESSLLVYDEEADDLVFVLARGPVAEQLMGRHMPLDRGIAGWVYTTRQSSVVNSPYADDRFYSVIDELLHFHTRTILAAPLSGGGQVLGVMEMLNKWEGGHFDSADQTLAELLCRFTGQILYLMMQQDDDSSMNLGGVAAEYPE